MSRVIDIFVSSVCLFLASPIILVCICIIRASSPGPGLFKQLRLGQHEQPFTCLKLRTMKQETGDMPTHLTTKSMVIRGGHLLRASKLDELPQLWNVLKGEMSLIGPRPGLASQHELTHARRANGVFKLRPGITGLAQVLKADMSRPARLASIDGTYGREKCLKLDLHIVLATVGLKRIVRPDVLREADMAEVLLQSDISRNMMALRDEVDKAVNQKQGCIHQEPI